MVKGKLLESGASDSLIEAIRPEKAGLQSEMTEDDAFGDGASKDWDNRRR
jgi:hypothetical protein